MKNKSSLIFLLPVLFALTSCGVQRYTAPPFTDVDRILRLKSGLSATDVSSTLGIKPHDVVHCFETGSKILIFNYRVKDRNMVVASRSARNIIHSEEAQREGELWYNEKHKELFLLFKNDTLSGIYGERMFSDGSYLEIAHSRFTSESQEKAGAMVGNQRTFQDKDYYFLENLYHGRSTLKEMAVLQEDENIKKRKTWLTYVGIGALFVISTLIGG